MYKLTESIVIAFMAIFLVAFAALLGGTIVYLIWPVAVNAFPGLVTAGYVAAEIPWWTAVCLVWLVSILVKSTTTLKDNR
jgi:hypothetical protein